MESLKYAAVTIGVVILVLFAIPPVMWAADKIGIMLDVWGHVWGLP